MPMPDERVQDLTSRYTSQAQAYKELWAPVLLDFGQKLLRELPQAPAARVLDIGCGVGTLLPRLQAAFPHAVVHGVDLAAGMLRLAPAESHRAVMDAARLGFATASFDVAIMAFVLFHLPAPAAALLEAKRALRPGGSIATATWGSDLESPATRLWDQALDAHGASPLDADADLAHHELVDTPEKVRTLLEGAGFAAIRAWVEPFERHIDRQYLERLRTSVGRNKRRFDSLDAKTQAACLESVRLELAALQAGDFVAKAAVVFATARA